MAAAKDNAEELRQEYEWEPMSVSRVSERQSDEGTIPSPWVLVTQECTVQGWGLLLCHAVVDVGQSHFVIS